VSAPTVLGVGAALANDRRAELMALVARELDRAYAKHGRELWGRHEFYAILQEEVDELWDAIKSDASPPDLLSEMVHVVAMVFRYFETGNRYSDLL
jgi:NTP pyrophosphatase (non-canonical NTP hydrolase)